MKLAMKYWSLAVVIIGFVGLNSCSKDDDYDDIALESAVGTYKGELQVFRPKVASVTIKDAIVTITKVSDTELKVTPPANSGATPKTFTVESIEGDLMNPDINDPKGIFLYYADRESVSITTNRQTDTEANFIFKGAQQ